MKKRAQLTLGEKIRQIREAKGLSQVNIAAILNCSNALVSRMELGSSEIDSEKLTTIRKALGIENAPLTKHELEAYTNRLWLWHEMVVSERLSEAKDMKKLLATILDLPYERDLILIYVLIETLMLYRERFTAGTAGFLKKFEEAEALFVPDEASPEAAFLYHRNKGYQLYTHKDYKNAVYHYLKVLDIDSDVLKPDAQIYAGIGYILQQNAYIVNATLYLERAKMSTGIERSQSLWAKTDAALATCYAYLGNYKKAHELTESSLAYFKNVNDRLHIGLILGNKGCRYKDEGDLNEALSCLDQSQMYFEHPNAHTLLNKAECLRKMNKLAMAKEAIEEGMALVQADDELTILFKSQLHPMTIDTAESAEYLHNVVVPFLFSSHSGLARCDALRVLKELESHYTKKGTAKKTAEIVSAIRDFYDIMLYGGAR